MLVRRDEPVEPLVTELVDGDALDVAHAGLGRVPLAAGRDERRVLHAAGLLGAARRVHDRERFHRDTCRTPRRGARGRNGRRRARSSRRDRSPGGKRHRIATPSAVVAVTSWNWSHAVNAKSCTSVCTKRRSTRPFALASRSSVPGRADDEPLGHVDGDVVGAVVRVELARSGRKESAPSVPSGSSRASFGNHCATMWKLPSKPVRSAIDGSSTSHATSIVSVSSGLDRARQRDADVGLVLRIVRRVFVRAGSTDRPRARARRASTTRIHP